MRCPQCLQTVPESTKHCQCGFAFDDVALVDLPDWFAQNQQTLTAAYTEARTPWQQSGKSGTFEDWVRLRIANLAPVQRSGTYLDIGCANGYLLECLVVWALIISHYRSRRDDLAQGWVDQELVVCQDCFEGLQPLKTP
jgi:hypothetical protein